MEGNRDESEKCIHLAKKFFSDGQKEKAIKYLFKAERLFPSLIAKNLIEQFQNTDESSKTNKSDSIRNGSSSPFQRKRSVSMKEYTQEQVNAVKRIIEYKDHYKILGVNKYAGDAEIKKQYYKLALQFHPDKNKVPDAADAFKAIGNAFAILNDVEKRKVYDFQYAEEQRLRHVSREKSHVRKGNGQTREMHHRHDAQQNEETGSYRMILFLILFCIGLIYLYNY